MIRHFLIRDFKTYRLMWIVCAIATVLAVGAIPVFSSLIPLVLLGYVYFFIGLIPPQQITGVRLRSQHIMSRNYLLALPIKRTSLFVIIQYRSLMFWGPLILLLLIVPLLPVPKALFREVLENHYGLYCLGILSGFVWLINSMISIQLAGEKITTYLTQQKRAFAWIKALGFYLGEFALVGGLAFGFIRFGVLSDIFVIMGLLGIAGGRFYFARKGWLHHQ